MVNLKLQIPDGFLNGENRNGYFVSPKMKKIWAVELDLLKEFMGVCERHSLKFYADAGTMLGAVRHGGMIPWDDDIDVIMMRDQYDKFCEIAPKEFKHPYFFQTEETDLGSLRGHAQLRNSLTTGILAVERSHRYKFNQGIFIDIFPIEAVPDKEEDLKKQTSRLWILQKQYLDWAFWTPNRYVKPTKFGKRILKRFQYFQKNIFENPKAKTASYYQQFQDELRRYECSDSEYVAKLVLLPFRSRRLWKRADFSGVTYLPFEMLTIPVPSGYEHILDSFYGNWREFKVGTATHGGVFFDVDKPYTEYIR